MNGILQTSLEETNTKPFYRYIKAQKNDNFGISSLKFNGLMYSDSSSKSEILNEQFQSVFTKESTTATPRLFGNKYPSIGNLSITLKGVQKLLEKINISKAAGPDLNPGRMLNMLAPELAPIVHAIFTQNLDTGELPRDLDGRQCGNNLALCNFAVVMELPDSLYMNWKSEFGVIFLRCSPR